MSQADELLNSLSEGDISLQLANPETEPHIVIGEDRIVSVPKELQRIAVQYDHDVETVTFDCPRYWDGLDMSKMSIYINYMRKDRYVACYKATDITVDAADSNIIHFNWTVSRNVSEVKGELKFLVCIKKGDKDGNEVNHWNSELNTEMYISEGLEVEPSIFDPYPDIIGQWEDEVNAVKQILLDARDSGELDGATFTPSVDTDGNLSWTNDKGRANPATVNVKGYSPRIIVKEIAGGKQFVITDYSGSQTVDILNGKDGKDGTNGTNGTDGENGYSPRIIVREVTGGHQLVITDYTGSQTVDVMDGADGQDGAAGTNGTDGVSPTVTVANVTGGHRVTITDKDGAKTFDVKDGTNTSETGSDGVSPTVSVVEITGGHRVTITDVDGAKAFDVMDGETGATGATGKNGYSPKILVREVDGGHQLVITDYSGSQTVDVMNGADGAAGAAGKDGTNGTNGQDGEDGYSPTVATEAVTGGTKVTITDKTGTKVFTVLNGTNGTDGVSPIVTVTDISGGHRVTITDKDGAKSFDVMDGEGGSTDSTPVYVGETEPTSGPVLWFDTSSRSTG